MKNFKKRFLHAVKYGNIRSNRINLKRRLFMGKNIYVDINNTVTGSKIYYLVPFCFINLRGWYPRCERVNRRLIKRSLGLTWCL